MMPTSPARHAISVAPRVHDTHMKRRDLTRHRERDEREQRMWGRYSIQVDTALTVIDRFLEEGDLRVAIELLRSFTRRSR